MPEFIEVNFTRADIACGAVRTDLIAAFHQSPEYKHAGQAAPCVLEMTDGQSVLVNETYSQLCALLGVRVTQGAP